MGWLSDEGSVGRPLSPDAMELLRRMGVNSQLASPPPPPKGLRSQVSESQVSESQVSESQVSESQVSESQVSESQVSGAGAGGQVEIEPECEPEPEGPAEAGAAESGIEPELDMKEASPEETFQPSALDRWAEIRAQLHSDASLADAVWLSNSEPDVVFGHVLPIEPQPAPAKESDAASDFEVEANTHAGSAPEAEPAENAAIELEAASGEPDAIEIIADVFPQMDEDHTAVPEEELAVAASPPEAIAEDLAAQVDEAETVEQPVAVEGPEPASTANIIDPVVESGEDEMPEPRLKASGNVKLEAIDGARVGAKFLGKSVLLGAAGARCLMDRFDLPVGTHVKLSLIAPRFVDQIDVPDAIVLGADPVQGKFQVQVAFAERHDELETFVLQHFGNKPPPGGFFSRFRR